MQTITLDVSTKGQIIIPFRIRKLLGIEVGSKVSLIPDLSAKVLTIVPTLSDPIAESEGFLYDDNDPNAFKDILLQKRLDLKKEEKTLKK